MVLMRFTKLLPKLFAGKKGQTIRIPRKIVRKDGTPPIAINSQLDVYALLRVGTAQVTKMTKEVPVGFIEDDQAIKDGFNNKEECIATLKQMYKCDSWQEFDIIEYEPHWTPFYVIDKNTLELLQHLARERDLILKLEDLDSYQRKNYELTQLLHKIKSLEITAIKASD